MRRTSFFRQSRPSSAIYMASFAGLIICVAAIEVIGFDVWWHLATGRVITTLGQIPRNDIFSYTAFGNSWLNHEWLFQTGQWLLFDAFGTSGLIAMKVALVLAISLALFLTTSSLAASKNLALWGVVVFLLGSPYRILDRPFLLGMLFLALYMAVLHGYARRGGRAVWALPLVQILWINCHAGAMLGAQMIGAFALGETLQIFAGRRLGGPEPVERRRVERLWLIFIACLGACAINPWGADIFPFYAEHFGAENILRFTEEWMPPLHPELDGLIPPLIFLGVAAATLLSFALNARRARLSHLLVTFGTLFMLTKGHRFGPEMMIANIPIMMMNFSQAAGVKAGNAVGWINVAAAFAISALALAFGIPITLKGEMWNIPGRGATIHGAPAGMVEFLDEHEIRGRVLNDMGFGAYLIFSRWPEERVFIDGRTPVYGDEFFGEHIDIFRNNRNFEEAVRKYDIDYIVLAGFRAWNQRLFHSYLWIHPAWRLVYATNQGYVYLRDVPKFRGLIERLSLPTHPVVEEMKREAESRQLSLD